MSRRRARCSSSSASSSSRRLVSRKRCRLCPLAVDQRVADEQLPRQRDVHLAEGHEPVGDERYAVERDPLVGHHRGALLRPVRLGVGPLHQVRAELLGPLGLDRGVLPGPEPRGLDQLAGHQELRVLPVQSAAREDREARPAGAEVLAWPPWIEPSPCDRAPRAGRCATAARPAAPGGCRRRRGSVGGRPDLDLHLLADLAQLRLEVLPLADPEPVEELPLAHPPERRRGELALLLLDVAPQVEPGEEVAALGLEPRVLLVGLRLQLGGSLPRVLQRQRGGDHDHLADAAEPLRLEHHPRQPRVDGQPGQPPADLGRAGRRREARPAPPAAGRRRRRCAGPAARRTGTAPCRPARARPSAG